MSSLTGPDSSARHSKDKILMLSSPPLRPPQPPAPLQLLAKLQQHPQRRVYLLYLTPILVPEKKKEEEEAEVDMGGLFGDDY